LKSLILIPVFLLTMLSGYAQTPGNTGLVLDDDAYNNIPQQSPTRALAALPASYSLKMYAPDPANQGDNQTCTAWASAYCAGTIIQAIRKHLKERAEINQLAYSAANAYFMAHHAVDCQTALKFTDVMDMMKGACAIPASNVLPLPISKTAAWLPSLPTQGITGFSARAIQAAQRF
jgi:hypothetical protein